MTRITITAQGAERLRAELQRLKYEERPRIAAAIGEARAHGDLRENAEYHAAKEQQSFIEGKIAEIEDTLARAHVVDTTALPEQGRVVFGATVELVDVETDASVRYQIVGEIEADIGAGLISVTSPVARALIGKEEGEVVVVEAPGGSREFEIVEVCYR